MVERLKMAQKGRYANDTPYGRLHNICRNVGMGFDDATRLIGELILDEAENAAKHMTCDKCVDKTARRCAEIVADCSTGDKETDLVMSKCVQRIGEEFGI